MADNKPNSEIRVLVTGASGFIAIHCVQQLLAEGYQVRGTVRSLSNEAKIKPLKSLKNSENLELVEADLTNAAGWSKAVEGCTYVLHVASPFLIVADHTIIQTAVDGTMNVLRAAAKEPAVKKVVLTSSCAAIQEGRRVGTEVISEKLWSVVGAPSVSNYAKSKTLAEKAAWDFVNNDEEGKKIKLTTINPTLVVGPLLHNTEGASTSIVKRFMNHEMPAVPGFSIGLVDVRDVALAHIKAMRNPKSDGERILTTATPALFFREIGEVLHREFSNQGYHIPKIQVPYAILWLYSLFDAEAREAASRVGPRVRYDNSKARNLLGIRFRDTGKALITMAYDMIERGMIPKTPEYKGPPSMR